MVVARRTFMLRRQATPVLQHWSSCRIANLTSNESKILLSKSNNIYENLSIEDWLYNHLHPLPGRRIIFVWRNQPCIVVGKFQNQWRECDVGYLAKHGIRLARRKSGGGTVYHDLGNINLTFLTHRSDYNRKENLETVSNALSKRFPHIHLSCNKRDDIILNNAFKVSGSAAKMTRDKAYHHFTLLVNSDGQALRRALASPLKEMICTKASHSTPHPTCNLSSDNHIISPEEVVLQLTHSYKELFSQLSVEEIDYDEQVFPGISDILSELQSWQWIYGNVPDFTITYEHHVTKDTLRLTVEKGLVVDLVFNPENSKTTDLSKVFHHVPFCPIILSHHVLRSERDIPADLCSIMDSFLNTINPSNQALTSQMTHLKGQQPGHSTLSRGRYLRSHHNI